jgi:hypothetical protein
MHLNENTADASGVVSFRRSLTFDTCKCDLIVWLAYF